MATNHVKRKTGDREFYRGWIAANGLSESFGLGTTFLLGSVATPLLVRAEAVSEVLLTALIAVVLGTVLEGIVVGVAQGRVLHARAPQVGLRSWVTATALGAGLAWMVGMIPSSVISLTGSAASTGAPPEPTLPVRILLAAGLGFVTGPILGVAQWIVLRRHFDRAGSWLWANAFAWATGMPVIFGGMELVPWEGSAVARAAAVLSVCLAAGSVVGAVHGPVLMHMTRSSAPGRAPPRA